MLNSYGEGLINGGQGFCEQNLRCYTCKIFTKPLKESNNIIIFNILAHASGSTNMSVVVGRRILVGNE